MEEFDIESAVEVKNSGFDINSAVEVAEDNISFYNDNTKNIVNSTFNDPVKINYNDLVQFKNKSREDFVGMVDISQDDNKKYSNDFANNFLVSKALDFSRGFTAFPINMYQSAKRSIGHKVAAQYGRLVYSDKSKYTEKDLDEFLANLDEAALEMRDTQKKFIDELGLSKVEKDGVSYDLGGVTSNIMATIALKSPALISALYGISGQQELYEESIESGMSRGWANTLSIGVASANAFVEYYGTEKLLSAIKGNNVITSIFYGALSEGIEESLQNIIEDTAMVFTGVREKNIKEIAQDTLYAGLLGAIGGAGGAGIGHIFYNGRQELINNGATEIEADNTINKVADTLRNPGLQEEVINLIKRENDNTTYNGNNYVEGAKYIKEIISKQDSKENILNIVDNILQNERKVVDTELNNISLNKDVSQDNFDKIRESIKDNVGNLQQTLKQLKNKNASFNFDGYEVAYKQLKFMEKVANQPLPRQPATLSQWIKQQGGIYDGGGELKSMGFNDLIRQSTEKKGATKFENTADYILKKAVEDGFFGNKDYRSLDINDLFNAIEEDRGGNYIYKSSDSSRVANYENRINQSNQAEEMLSSLPFNYKEFIEIIEKSKDFKLKVMTENDFDSIKKETSKLKDDVRYLKARTKQDIKQVQSQLTDIIQKSSLSPENKSKFITDIKNIQTQEQLEANKRNIIEKIDNLIDSQIKNHLKDKIDKELFHTNNVKQGNRKVGKYLYEVNKFFEDLRSYNKISQEQAINELANLKGGLEYAELKDTLAYSLKEKFLNYKSQGLKDSSRGLIESIYNDVLNIKKYSADEKLMHDELKRNKKVVNKNEVLEAINNNKADKKTLKTKLTTSLYVNQVGNQFDIMNYLTNKNIAEKYNLELDENRLNQIVFNKENRLNAELKETLNVKHDWELLASNRDLRVKDYDLYDPRSAAPEKISKMEIMDIYNSIKNDKKKADFYKHYGDQQINDLISNLSQNEKAFADSLMNSVDNYDEVNDVFIRLFNTDLKKESNYWPATSEHENNFSVFGTSLDLDGKNKSLSFTKERVVQNVIPIVSDAYNKAVGNIQQTEYLINMSEKYKQIADIFYSPDIQFAIKNKFGDGVIKSMREQLNNQSLSSRKEYYTTTNKLFNKLLSNWTVAKIGASFPVFFRQMGAISNYSIDVKTTDWLGSFKDGLIHPKNTINYMTKIDFVNERLNSGYNQELKRAMTNDFEFVKLEKALGGLGRRIDNINFTEIFTSMVRYGDIGSVIFGGYANIQANIKAGMSEQQAIEKFKQNTLRTQQSGLNASLSPAQQNKNAWTRMLLTFRNAGIQYQRNTINAIIQYNKGEIKGSELSKTLLHYLIIQPAIYTYMGKLAKDLFLSWGDDEDDKESDILEDFKDIGWQTINTFTIGSPVADGIAEFLYKRATNQQVYSVASLPLLSDTWRTVETLKKREITLQDFINMGLDFAEPMTSIPTKNINKIQKQFTGFDLRKDFD